MDSSKINQVGTKYDRELYFKARQLCIQAVDEVATKVEVGMSEADGHLLIDEVLKSKGYKKYWHPHKFRIGENTICAFRDVSNESVRLKENDIFFVDIGPIFFDHEADYGRTYVFGENLKYKEVAMASETLFRDCENQWATRNLSGAELYGYARSEAEKMGYLLEDRQGGHRLGDFPHAVHFRGRLGEVSEKVHSDLWILEIHLTDQDKQYGAFFEDILVRR